MADDGERHARRHHQCTGHSGQVDFLRQRHHRDQHRGETAVHRVDPDEVSRHDVPGADPTLIAWAGAAGFIGGLVGTEICRRRR